MIDVAQAAPGMAITASTPDLASTARLQSNAQAWMPGPGPIDAAEAAPGMAITASTPDLASTAQSWNSILWDLYGNDKIVPYDNVLPESSFSAVDSWGNSILNYCSGSTNGQAACTAEANIVYSPPGTKPISVTVPALMGLSASQAKTLLTNDFLVETISRSNSATTPFNHVCGQSIAAGTVVDPGTTVNVCISNGAGGP